LRPGEERLDPKAGGLGQKGCQKLSRDLYGLRTFYDNRPVKHAGDTLPFEQGRAD